MSVEIAPAISVQLKYYYNSLAKKKLCGQPNDCALGESTTLNTLC